MPWGRVQGTRYALTASEHDDQRAPVRHTNVASLSEVVVGRGRWARHRRLAAACRAGVPAVRACHRPVLGSLTRLRVGLRRLWQGAGPLFRHGLPGCPSQDPPTPQAARSAKTTSPGCAPTWRRGAAASDACPASASFSALAAPSVLAGRRPGGTPPPAAARPPAPHPAPAPPPRSSGRTLSRPAWPP